MTWPARHVTCSIARPPAVVYAFLRDPRNLPRWASGLSGGIRQEGADWISDAPMGRVKVAFAPENTYGVLDHDVTLADGQTFHNPMRVVPNDSGSEVSFTVFRRDGVDDAAFDADAATVGADLERARALLAADPA